VDFDNRARKWYKSVCKSPLENRKPLLLFSANHEPSAEAIASRTKRQQSNKATITSRGRLSTASAVHSYRGRERGREGGRADIRPELLSPQKLFEGTASAEDEFLYTGE
jgi:hypothetical protein